MSKAKPSKQRRHHHIQCLNEPSDLLPLLPSFADLAHCTEFNSYKDPQWRFLFNGEEITGFVSQSKEENESMSIDGCLLKVHLDDKTCGAGMFLVSRAKRGTGLARALIDRAKQHEEHKRFILAVCTPAGQPLYVKYGFQRAGMVTAVTCSVSDLMKTPSKISDQEQLLVNDGKCCNEEQISFLANQDANATGMNRKDRIKVLLNEYAKGSRSTVAILSKDGIDDGKSYSTAMARQDCLDGPLIIGPMQGKEESCIPLMQALVEKRFGDDETEISEMKNVNVMMMISNHPNLVTSLMEMKGMSKLFENPAMTSDGRPIYENGDGSYLAIMHPTLG